MTETGGVQRNEDDDVVTQCRYSIAEWHNVWLRLGVGRVFFFFFHSLLIKEINFLFINLYRVNKIIIFLSED